MANGSLPQVIYTSREFFTIKAQLINLVRRRFPNDWKDFRESAMGMAWLELVAYVGDILSHNLNVRARGLYVATAEDRIDMINIGRLVGFKLTPATSASLLATATIASTDTKDIIIPGGTTFQSNTGVIFTFLEEGRIPSGSTTAKVTAVEGEVILEAFTSNGDKFQSFQLGTSPVIAGSVTVTVNGTEWDETESLVFGDETSQVYEFDTDEDDFGYIFFGNGQSGFIPPEGSTVVVEYRVGGGVQGNIPLENVNVGVEGQREGVVPVETVQVQLTNPDERGTGGEPRMSIEEARFLIPRSVKTNGRAVTQEDFETLAQTFVDPVFGAPSHASARLKQRIPELNTVEVFLWARDETGEIALPGTNLINAVQGYFDNNGPGAVRIITVDTEVQEGVIVYVDVDVSVRPSTQFASATVLSNVVESIEGYFENISLVRPGEDVRISQLYREILNSEGSDYALINNIKATLRVTEVMGTGDGTTKQFQYLPENLMVAQSISVTDGTQLIVDDGSGGLEGDLDATGTNLAEYSVPRITVTFDEAPADGAEISLTYRYVLSYQRGELELVASGTTNEFEGALDFKPVVPGSVGISDGSQVVIDDGNGNLVDATRPYLELGTIDYDTGYFSFAFGLAPAAGAEINSVYKQFLSTDYEDLPITQDQVEVKSLIDVAAITQDTTD